MTGTFKAILAAVCSLLFILGGCQPIDEEMSISMVAQTMYTVDSLHPFQGFSHISDFVMRLTSLHGINTNAPYWEIDITLENPTSESMKGFLAMEFALFSPEKQSMSGLPDMDFFDFCSLRNEYENVNATDTNHRIQFYDWKFDGVALPFSADAPTPTYLHFNATHPVHETGLWVNIIHLCVTEDDQIDYVRWTPWKHQDLISIDGSQTAVNPLGLLSGDALLAFPCLFGAECCYIALFVVYVLQLIRFRKSMIPSIHWTLLIGLILFIADTAWRYFGIWRLNTIGYDDPSLALMIGHQIITHILTLYYRTAVLIISTGTGIVRPNLGKTMVRFLVIYGVIYCLVHGRIEWVEFALFQSRWSREPTDFEIRCIKHLLFILDFGFIIVSYFNLMAAKSKLDQQQHHKLSLLNRLVMVAWFQVLSSLLLSMANDWADDNVDSLDPQNWALMYMLEDGLRIGKQIIVFSIVVGILQPHAESTRMAFSAEIPTTEPEDNATPSVQSGGVAEEVELMDEEEDRAWDEMVEALRAVGRRMKERIVCLRSNANDGPRV